MANVFDPQSGDIFDVEMPLGAACNIQITQRDAEWVRYKKNYERDERKMLVSTWQSRAEFWNVVRAC